MDVCLFIHLVVIVSCSEGRQIQQLTVSRSPACINIRLFVVLRCWQQCRPKSSG